MTGVVISLLLVVLTFVFYTVWRSRDGYRNLPLPPGPSRLPFIGSAHKLPLRYQQQIFNDWRNVHGDIIYVQIFNKPAIVLNSVEAMEDLLNKRSGNSSDRPRTILITEIIGYTNNITVMPYSDQWRRQRRWFQTAIQSTSALQSYVPLQRRETVRLLAAFVDASQRHKNDQTGYQTGQEVFAGLKRYGGALMMDIAYGHSVLSLDDEFVVLSERAIAGIAEAGAAAASLIDFFPILRYIPAWLPGAHVMAKAAAVRKLTRQMIDAPYERVHASLNQGTARPCFLTTLLDECTVDGVISDYDKEDVKGAASLVYAGTYPAFRNLCSHLKNYIAGTDTTATALTSSMLALVLYPDAQRKAQEEIDAVVGTERLPEFEDRALLPYVEALVKEVLRWNPPAPLAIPHKVAEEDKCGSYAIPAGTMIIPNIWAVMRDPMIYADPDTFRPERFTSASPERDPRNYVFGFGRRICPGQAFADSSSWLAIARILATFDVTKAHDPATGAEIAFEPEFISGMISHVLPFPFEVKPRSNRAVGLIRELQSEYAE
ncbi:cytochrome P450 [Daedalea quercina L-15889]|uniref:Cytochrome P450 n=1 Tax=Daedalea quercina L-15889 TaxID=1314783 RepID=A0A165QP81_9APHY|nr:cytochrome P450 [Daedalea quercina L-15889]